jgi:hypothetical protein
MAQVIWQLPSKHEDLSSNLAPFLKKKKSWALMAHSCNPSYLGG